MSEVDWLMRARLIGDVKRMGGDVCMMKCVCIVGLLVHLRLGSALHYYCLGYCFGDSVFS